MSHAVKSVFLILILAIVTPAIVCGVIEFYNVYTNTYKLRPLVEIAIDQADKMFSEETFLMGGETEALLPNLRTNDNVWYGANLFNGAATQAGRYNYLMDYSSTPIKDFARGYDVSVGTSDTGDTLGSDAPWKVFERTLGYLVEDGNFMSVEWNPIGEVYRSNFATPMNFGLPYLDEDTVTQISSWNMAQILNTDGTGKPDDLSEDVLKNVYCNSGRAEDPADYANAPYDPLEGYYVYWNGYRVYFDDLKLNIHYRLLDMNNSEHKKVYQELTHINPDVVFKDAIDDQIEGMQNEWYAMVAEVDYEVPIIYEGVTPWRRYYQWLFTGGFGEGHWASGMNGFKSGMTGGAPAVGADAAFDGSTLNMNKDDPRNLLKGRVVHYIVR